MTLNYPTTGKELPSTQDLENDKMLAFFVFILFYVLRIYNHRQNYTSLLHIGVYLITSYRRKHNYKVPTKCLEYFGNHRIIWKWDVWYYIALQSVFFLLYNAALFVTIASCRADILPLGDGEVRNDMCHIWAQQNNPQWYWLKLSSWMTYWMGWMEVFFQCLLCYLAQIKHISFLTLPPPKGNIWALCNGIQYNTIQ